jgi:hypothetical protein
VRTACSSQAMPDGGQSAAKALRPVRDGFTVAHCGNGTGGEFLAVDKVHLIDLRRGESSLDLLADIMIDADMQLLYDRRSTRRHIDQKVAN